MFYPFRAEKERAQYFSEVNDLRAGLDHLSNEKVQKDKERCHGKAHASLLIQCWKKQFRDILNLNIQTNTFPHSINYLIQI